MSLIERLDADLKEAMKAKDDAKLSTLRMAKAALKNKQIDLGKPLEDADAQAVLRTLVKQYKDAVQDFQAAGRTDLAEKQREEIALLETYLPAAMGEEELSAIIDKVLAANGPVSPKEMGKVMGLVMKEVAGRADGNVVREAMQKKMA